MKNTVRQEWSELKKSKFLNHHESGTWNYSTTMLEKNGTGKLVIK